MQGDGGEAGDGQRRGDQGCLVIELEQGEHDGLEQQGHQRQRDRRQRQTHQDGDPQQGVAQVQHLLMALALADGLAHNDGGGGAQAEAHHQEQAVQVAHDGVGRQILHGVHGVAQNHGKHAVAKAPGDLIEQYGGGVFDEPAAHLPARVEKGPQAQGNGPAAQGADKAHGELRHAADESSYGGALHAQHGEARLAEDQQVVHAGVDDGRHAEQLHAEGGVLHAALGADVDGRQHVEHVGKSDNAQVRRAQQRQLVLVAEQVHDLHGPDEERRSQHGGDPHAQIGGYAHGAADIFQILFAPVLADEDPDAGLYAEYNGDQQEYRHVGGGDGGHFRVSQLADH